MGSYFYNLHGILIESRKEEKKEKEKNKEKRRKKKKKERNTLRER